MLRDCSLQVLIERDLCEALKLKVSFDVDRIQCSEDSLLRDEEVYDHAVVVV